MSEIRNAGVRHIADVLQERSIVLKGADRLSVEGFTQVPNAVLKSDKISPGAKLAYTMLLSYAWHNNFCFPGQARLARDMGVSRRSAVTYIQELCSEHFVNVKKRGQGRTNIYELILTTKKRTRRATH